MTKIKRNDRDTSMEEMLSDTQRIIEELQNEHTIILKRCAMFTHFLQKYSITTFEDNCTAYVEYLINR